MCRPAFLLSRMKAGSPVQAAFWVAAAVISE